jgi:hypothetical protein
MEMCLVGFHNLPVGAPEYRQRSIGVELISHTPPGRASARADADIYGIRCMGIPRFSLAAASKFSSYPTLVQTASLVIGLLLGVKRQLEVRRK